jgi:hypothetical protein
VDTYALSSDQFSGSYPASFPSIQRTSFGRAEFFKLTRNKPNTYMKKETIFLSLTALFIGLIVAGGIFYAYQFLTNPGSEKPKMITLNATPTPVSSNSEELMVQDPTDESVAESRSVMIYGKTLPGSMVIVTSENDEQVVTPAANGNFSLTTTISNGVNMIEIIAILPDGRERKVIRTVTYTTESF